MGRWAIIPPVRYLLDGYNLAHWLADGDDLQPEALRRLLLDALARRRPRDARSITIYWDAKGSHGRAPQNEYSAGVIEHFVPIADDAIVDAVAGDSQPRTLLVVSRDREVTGRSRQLGARIATPADLLSDKRRSGRRPGGRRRGR